MTTKSILETEDTASHLCRMQAIAEAEAQASNGHFVPEPETLPKLSASSYAIHNAFNCSAVFGTARGGERKHGRAVYLATNGFTVVFSGTELRQDDKAVLLELVHRRRGLYAGDVEFAPSTFCRSLGWSDNTDSKVKLKQCLERLVEATLKIERDANTGMMFSLIAKFKYDGDRWLVRMDDDIVKLFPTGLKNASYLNIESRKLLTAGMQTWLYDYICSNNCQLVLTYATLRAACGRPDDDPKTFVEYVKAALAKLQGLGLIKGYKSAKNAQSQAGVWIDKK